MLEAAVKHLKRPKIDSPSTDKFWDHEHISKNMLKAHLLPDRDGASRKHAFINASVEWIAKEVPPEKYPALLDLGCGPGLYAERFHGKGYSVTGVDFSIRSIDYAKSQAEGKCLEINYLYQDYLTLNYYEAYDVITMIYCDYGVLSHLNRRSLQGKILSILKPGGKFIFDVFTPFEYKGIKEETSWKYHPGGGFWRRDPHLSLQARYRYDDYSAVLDQAIIIEEEAVSCYNLWNHYFTGEQLAEELQEAGFSDYKLYGDVAGKSYTEDSKTICVIAVK